MAERASMGSVDDFLAEGTWLVLVLEIEGFCDEEEDPLEERLVPALNKSNRPIERDPCL
jgi:hypothetical protein